MNDETHARRRQWLEAKTAYDEVVSYNEFVATGDATWEDLLCALGRLPINAEDAALRLHTLLAIPKVANRLVLDPGFWRDVLARRGLALAAIAGPARGQTKRDAQTNRDAID